MTLRSREGVYHSLILFRLSAGQSQTRTQSQHTEEDELDHGQIYVMEASCPHLGADMSHAEIEECETGVVAVCPWHRYDFDLRTGASETGLKACTYAVEVRADEDGAEAVWMQIPEGGTNWRLVELRPVSEEFADPSPPPDLSHLAISPPERMTDPPFGDIVPAEGAPTTLMQWAVLILNTADPRLKVERTRHAVQLFRMGQLKSIGHRSAEAPTPPDVPLRDEAYTRNTMDPGRMGKRKNKAMMLHALANIEQWAIDLAWDIMARYGPEHPDLPPAFFSDFTKMALDESKHFSLLVSRLAAISPSTPYGTMPVHAGLWDSARVTFNSLRARLAIIHLVHEARGLDVNPGTIERFRRAGDADSVRALEVIHHDEVTHVTTGHRWFTWVCAKQGVDPVPTLREEVRRCWKGDVKGPFNVEDREKAGLTRDFYEDLRGEMSADWEKSKETA
ncbi:DUF455-domain-containing protein [Laetiporus sulphureus 93-53]|uniref:DUF455-domain-containing protein n=1 Tax=Laetiporus sulphureus 93-53 TaxID=1314785 RepID=A0A165BZW2_9APHY|nr:DUF455-domain-containing protein [Laetiporus sulphureus 93-53]KZT01949.1 DUF455-domain-containing protein [Laetiporus sulphureus 93-53]